MPSLDTTWKEGWLYSEAGKKVGLTQLVLALLYVPRLGAETSGVLAG